MSKLNLREYPPRTRCQDDGETWLAHLADDEYPAEKEPLSSAEVPAETAPAETSPPAETNPPETLGGAVSGLRGAPEANVNLRLSGQGEEQAGVVEASNQTVVARRSELEAALQQASFLRL